MARFLTSSLKGDAIPDGTYIFKVSKAVERISENGNQMLVMTFALPDGRSLPCIITFVEKARLLVNAFVASAGLQKPPGADVEVELLPEHVRNRYVYATVLNDVSDSASDPVPKVVRFLSREAALLKNPSIAEITLQPQPPVTLPVVRKVSFS